MSNMPHYYETVIKWTGDRKGILGSPQLTNEIEVATPPEFPGGIEGIWSPEHLYTAAINSCLMTTFLAIAQNSKLVFNEFSCKANGKLELRDGQYLMTEVELFPVVTLDDELQAERALRVLDKAKKLCLISNSVTSVISMKPKIEVLRKEDQLSL